MAATRVRASAARSCGFGARAGRHLEQAVDLRGAGEGDGVDATAVERVDERHHRRDVAGRGVDVGRHAADGRVGTLERLDERPVGLLAVELQADAVAAEIERAQRLDHAGRGRHRRGEIGRQADLVQRARRLRAARHLAGAPQRRDGLRVNAESLGRREQAPQPLAREKDDVVEFPRHQRAQPRLGGA